MKHFRDVMNAEQWNPKVNKSANENDAKKNTIMRHDCDNMTVADPSSDATISKELNSVMTDHSACITNHELPTLENSKNIQSIPEKEATTPFLETDQLHVNQSKTVSSDAFKSKKRPKRSRLWMLLLSGFLVSIISGVAMAFWLLPIGNKSDISSQENYSDEREIAFDDDINDMVLSGEDQGYIPDDNAAMEDENEILDDELYADMLDDDNMLNDIEYIEENLSDFAGDTIYEELYAEAAEDDNILNDIEYTEDNLSDVTAEDVSFNEEFAMEPILREIKDTRQEAGNLTFKNVYERDDRIAAAISVIKENVNSKEKLIHLEVLEKPVEPEPEKKIEHTGAKKTSAVLSEKKQEEILRPSSLEPEVNNKTISESSKNKREEKAKPFQQEIVAKKKTSDTKKDVTDISTQSISSRVQKAKASPVGSDIGEKAIENAEPVEKTGKEIRQPILIPVKETSKEPVMMASIQEEPSPQKTDVKVLKTKTSSILKEMQVNYEDRFNTNNNKWPEYDNRNASAVIAKGVYHIESKIRSGSHTLLHPDGVPIDMDVMIDVSIASVRSSGETSYGLVFGAKDIRNNYSFLVRNDHLYSIEKNSEGIRTEIKGGQIDNIFISRDAQKSMKIVKRKNKVRFYIDGHLIDEISNIDYFGDKMGFLVMGKIKMSIDRTYTQIRFQKK